MSGSRLAHGGRIDRTQPLSFTWDGRALTGYRGDTLASALLANGVAIVGRSFKLHRPRGIYAAGPEEPNAVVDLEWDGRHDPSARATLVELAEGMRVKGANAWPNVGRDLLSLLDCMHGFLPAGFYYKTFIAPRWHTYEPIIRALAGIGRARSDADPLHYEARQAHCDILIVGGGVAGLAAARAAAASGLRIILAEQNPDWGGSTLWREGTVDGRNAADWVAATVTELGGLNNVRLMPRTTAFGSYDHNTFGLLERRAAAPEGWARDRAWQVKAGRVVLATGAIERPLVFPDNDRPGVMSADAVLRYIRQYGVLPGKKAVVLTNNDSALEVADALRAAGAEVVLADIRDGRAILGVRGTRGVKAVALGAPDATSTRGARWIEADLVAVSGGWSPAVHLYSQSGGKLRYDAGDAAFVPTMIREGQHLADGGDWASALASGHRAGIEAAAALGKTVTLAPPAPAPAPGKPVKPAWRTHIAGARQWVDLQNDVTVDDIELATRENYVSVEHLKRYTTLGMAHDQGKTSNINGLALLAEFTDRPIEAVGTTTFRPPYTPTSIGALVGMRHGPQFAPRRQLPIHEQHAAMGARFREYGGWMRPAFYPGPGESEAETLLREQIAAREAAGLFDASSLGKIEVYGPDAARFLDLIYMNEIGTLKPGRVRYCLLLRETGIVFDDGVVARLDANRFLLSPSSSHTEAVLAMLELWHQTEYPGLAVRFHDITHGWATFSVSGPKSRAVVEALGTDIRLDDGSLAHMSLARGHICGIEGRIARVSFTGERGYELSLPASYGNALWSRLREVGRKFGIVPFGVETLSALRAEKGYVMIGADTDGATLPADLGMGGYGARKTVDFVGRRSLTTPEALRPDRRQLVGLLAQSPDLILPVGAHAFAREDGQARSLGWVTSSAMSAALGRSIALGMIERGAELAKAGAGIEIFDQGHSMRARVCPPCFLDPQGERLHG